jgi:hypothetical protein
MVVIIFKGSEIFPFDDDANQISTNVGDVARMLQFPTHYAIPPSSLNMGINLLVHYFHHYIIHYNLLFLLLHHFHCKLNSSVLCHILLSTNIIAPRMYFRFKQVVIDFLEGLFFNNIMIRRFSTYVCHVLIALPMLQLALSPMTAMEFNET